MRSNKVKATGVVGDDIILTTELDDIEDMKRLGAAVKQLWPNKKFMIVQSGKLEQLSEQDMNGLGWYRKDDNE